MSRDGAAVSLFDDVLAELCADPEVRPGMIFGHRGAKLGRRVFAFDFDGDIVVKLGRDRAAELVAADRARLFDPMGGRPMRAWAQLPEPDAGDPLRAWIELAEEAKDVVRAER